MPAESGRAGFTEELGRSKLRSLYGLERVSTAAPSGACTAKSRPLSLRSLTTWLDIPPRGDEVVAAASLQAEAAGTAGPLAEATDDLLEDALAWQGAAASAGALEVAFGSGLPASDDGLDGRCGFHVAHVWPVDALGLLEPAAQPEASDASSPAATAPEARDGFAGQEERFTFAPAPEVSVRHVSSAYLQGLDVRVGAGATPGAVQGAPQSHQLGAGVCSLTATSAFGCRLRRVAQTKCLQAYLRAPAATGACTSAREAARPNEMPVDADVQVMPTASSWAGRHLAGAAARPLGARDLLDPRSAAAPSRPCESQPTCSSKQPEAVLSDIWWMLLPSDTWPAGTGAARGLVGAHSSLAGGEAAWALNVREDGRSAFHTGHVLSISALDCIDSGDADEEDGWPSQEYPSQEPWAAEGAQLQQLEARCISADYLQALGHGAAAAAEGRPGGGRGAGGAGRDGGAAAGALQAERHGARDPTTCRDGAEATPGAQTLAGPAGVALLGQRAGQLPHGAPERARGARAAEPAA